MSCSRNSATLGPRMPFFEFMKIQFYSPLLNITTHQPKCFSSPRCSLPIKSPRSSLSTLTRIPTSRKSLREFEANRAGPLFAPGVFLLMLLSVQMVCPAIVKDNSTVDSTIAENHDTIYRNYTALNCTNVHDRTNGTGGKLVARKNIIVELF